MSPLKKIASPTSTEYRVAILGHRGIPNSYGGFETLAEELAERLVDLGCSVLVYCRSNYYPKQPPEYKGAKLVYLPTVKSKTLDTFFHSCISVLHLLFKNTADTVIVVNVGNAPFAGLAKLFGKKVIFCVDGLDWQRKKWGFIARTYLRLCSHLASSVAHEVITDAASVQEFYKTERGTRSTLIPYGTDIETEEGSQGALRDLGLEYKKYFIYVARFEPENNPLLVIKAHLASGSAYPLVMIGDNRYRPAYVKKLKQAGGEKTLFLGFVMGARYKELLRGALAYIRAAEVGGTSPALIEAMGRGLCVLANDKPENREALSDAGLLFELNENKLTELIRSVSDHPEKAIALGERARLRAVLVYSWDRIAYEYYKLIERLGIARLRTRGPLRYPHAPKRILMLGAGGMLGEALYEHFAQKYIVKATDIDINEVWLSYLDVRDSVTLERTIRSFQPDYIFHLAAMTSLEECEKHMNKAQAVNALAVKHSAQLATRYGAKFIYISSAGIFDGTKDSYSDNDEPHPINVYGLTKQMGALMTEYYARDFIIIRPGWMMGGGIRKDKKFVAAIIRQIISGHKTIHAVTDKLGTPSYTHDIAKNLEILLQRNCHGTYNMVCSGGGASRFDVAKEIVRLLGFEKEINVIPVDSHFFSHTFFANRPHSETLINDRLTKEEINLMRPWKSALKNYLERDFGYAFNYEAEPASRHV